MFSTRKHGGLEGTLLWAIDQTKTNMGKRALKKWISRPLLDKNSIYARQDAVEVCCDGLFILQNSLWILFRFL